LRRQCSSPQEQDLVHQKAKMRNLREARLDFLAACALLLQREQAEVERNERGLDLVREAPREIDVAHGGYGRLSVARSLEWDRGRSEGRLSTNFRQARS